MSVGHYAIIWRRAGEGWDRGGSECRRLRRGRRRWWSRDYAISRIDVDVGVTPAAVHVIALIVGD